MSDDGPEVATSGDGAAAVGSTVALERRYRRWMEVFPADYRAHREEELIGVLLDRAEPGQERPRPAEVIDLVRAGLATRSRGFRGSDRQRAWGDAGRIVGMFLALGLAAQGLVYVNYVIMMQVNTAPWSDEIPAAAVRGWYVPAMWGVVVVLLLVGLERLAIVVAWSALAARVVATLSFLAADQRWRAGYTMPQLAAAILAVALLSHPARVRTVAERIGRWRMAGVVAVALAVHGLRVVRHGDVGIYAWAVALGLVALGCTLVRTQSVGAWASDPMVRRLVIGLVALLPLFLVSGEHTTNPFFAARAGSLVKDLVICLALVGVWFVTLASLPALLRRVPFRIVRREA